MATINKIESSTWGISLFGYGVIAEGIALIRQSIDLIIRTSKGSDPLRPAFGSNVYKYQDAPMDLAIPNIKKEIISALKLWEPRINLMSITHYLETPSTVVFEITYRVVDEGLIDQIIFDLKSGVTTGTDTEIILQAFFPANPLAYRYQISLIRNSNQVQPLPPASGFGSILELFNWAKDTWFFWGRWYLMNDRVVLYMKSQGVTNATMSIFVLSITRLEAPFPQLEYGETFDVIFKILGLDVQPGMPPFNNIGSVLSFAQNNWGNHGTWSVENFGGENKLVLLARVPGLDGMLSIGKTDTEISETFYILSDDGEFLTDDSGNKLTYQ